MKSIIDIKTERRCTMATQTAAGARPYSFRGKNASSADAILNGGMGEACQ